jgi:hypothetical protein
MTALALSAHRPDVAICDKCLDFCDLAVAKDEVKRGLSDGERGIGTFLMDEIDSYGHPWQALFYFDDQSRLTRLVTDEDGRPLGYRNKPDGTPYPSPDSYVALPEAVALAAELALAGHKQRT